MTTVSLIRRTVTRKLAGGKTRKEKSGCWRMRWLDPQTGERHEESTGTRDKSVARTIARQREQQIALIASGVVQVTYNANLPFSQLIKDFLAHCRKTKRPGTAAAYSHGLKNLTKLCKPHFVRDVTVKVLHQFTGLRRASGASIATVNRELREIRACLRWAMKCELIPAAPSFSGVFLREDRKQPVVVRDFGKVIDALPKAQLRYCSAGWWEVLLRLAHALGARRGELLGLVWGRVDLPRQALTILSETSKGRNDRTVPIPSALLPMLVKWQAAVPSGPTDPVLPYACGLRELYLDLAAIRKASGVKFNLKNLRSTCGSELAERGVNLAVVKDLLGHSSIMTTQRYYTNTQAALRSAVEARGA